MIRFSVVVDNDPATSSNMRHTVLLDGVERYRGPEWAARYRATMWNEGAPTMEDRSVFRRAQALQRVMGA